MPFQSFTCPQLKAGRRQLKHGGHLSSVEGEQQLDVPVQTSLDVLLANLSVEVLGSVVTASIIRKSGGGLHSADRNYPPILRSIAMQTGRGSVAKVRNLNSETSAESLLLDCSSPSARELLRARRRAALLVLWVASTLKVCGLEGGKESGTGGESRVRGRPGEQCGTFIGGSENCSPVSVVKCVMVSQGCKTVNRYITGMN